MRRDSNLEIVGRFGFLANFAEVPLRSLRLGLLNLPGKIKTFNRKGYEDKRAKVAKCQTS